MDIHHGNDFPDFEPDLEGQFDFDLFNQQNDLEFLTNTNAELENNGSIYIDKKISHVSVLIEGIEVLFPYPPYEPQKDYMTSVIRALNRGENALLQSPTGTGKTLCLLCATLAWMNKTKSHSQIFYSSRTHSQLKQVFEQLKKTCYRPVTTILASRDYSCIKYKDQFKGLQLLDACKAAIETKQEGTGISCGYYKKLQKEQSEYVKNYSRALCDIEDLFKEGQQKGFCPYYLQRKLLAGADIVFVPYIYLINPFLRSRMNINLTDKIIIFDEAHNIEKQIEEANSYQFSWTSLNKCQHYFTRLNELIRQNPDDKQLLDLDIRLVEIPILNLLKKFAAIKKNLERKLKERLPQRKAASKEERYEVFQNNKLEVFDGREIFGYFQNDMKVDHVNLNLLSKQAQTFVNGIDHTNFESFLQILDRAYEDEKRKMKTGDFKGLSTLSKRVFDLLLMDISAIKNNAQFDYSQNFIESYKLCFSLETGEQFDADLDTLPDKFGDNFFDLKIRLVCLNPGVGFASLTVQRPLSFLLTSGTLTPLESFESELMTKFPIKLINKHVINREIIQCKGFVASQGPLQNTLDFSYKNRKNENIPKDLGHAIVYIAQKVPNGILICFASYSLRDRCLRKWKDLNFENTDISIYDKLNSLKPIHLEIKEPVRLKEEIDSYLKSAKTKKGASLFCICRGKVSEGIDFAGEMARAVFLVGIPLPPARDPLYIFDRFHSLFDRIIAKKRFLDDKRMRNQQGLKGDLWYYQEATRAFNQAIGRVIRHKDDYGLVFLCDKRYGDKEFFEHISNWVKPCTEKSLFFHQIMNQIEPFFQECQNKFSANLQTNPTPPLNSLQENRNTHKRPGTEYARNISELKKVMQTPKVIHNKNNEFDVAPEQIFNLILGNQNQALKNANSFFPELLNNLPSQEQSNPNIMDPHPVLNWENTCDSSDPHCESCSRQLPLEHFRSPSKEGRPVCDKCWNIVDDFLEEEEKGRE